MATLSIIPIRRTGTHFYRHHQMLECQGCLERIEVARYLLANPERWAMFRERFESEHRVCCTFRSVRDAQRARREKWNARRKGKRGEVAVMRSPLERARFVVGGV